VRGLTISTHGELDRLELRDDLPVPQIMRATDVRIRIRAAALNHLDLFVVGGLPGVTITPPWVVGSDGMGVIEAVGSAVTTVAVGDTVLINPGTSDRTCEYCLSGDQPLCRNFRIFGATP
jgi:D-arabinose 1-dehydrogenase-like Zn-dependent alcohol dehydrogenase